MEMSTQANFLDSEPHVSRISPAQRAKKIKPFSTTSYVINTRVAFGADWAGSTPTFSGKPWLVLCWDCAILRVVDFVLGSCVNGVESSCVAALVRPLARPFLSQGHPLLSMICNHSSCMSPQPECDGVRHKRRRNDAQGLIRQPMYSSTS
jgi:hypothetical protein